VQLPAIAFVTPITRRPGSFIVSMATSSEAFFRFYLKNPNLQPPFIKLFARLSIGQKIF